MDEEKMRIGIAGTGKMGAAIAARLREQGEDVIVWNRSRAKAAFTGLPVAGSPGELSSRCHVVISALFDSDAQRSVYLGENGLLAAGQGRLFIDMSTVHPDAQRRMEAEVHKAKGHFVECPVGGTTGPARAGQLLGLAGGSVAAIKRARPILDKLCRRVEHVGPVGNGALAKLAINLPLVVFWQSFGEALALARGLGRDPQWLLDLFSDSAGAANVLKAKSSAVVAAMAGDRIEPTFDLNAMHKDLRTIADLADQHGLALPAAAATLHSLKEVNHAGLGGQDCAYLPAHLWGGRPD